MSFEDVPTLPARYQIVEKLGEGHMALVFKVYDRHWQRDVLLKLFKVNNQAAYRREVAVAFALKHENIVECVDTFYIDSGEACLIYEFLSQGTLSTLLVGKPLSRHLVLQVLDDVLSGLIFLHRRFFVHCDLKPDNILLKVDTQTSELRAVIADLGSATPIREARSGKQSIGSPAYTAPERLYEGFNVGSDLYSLGIIAFQLATGHLPFIGGVQEIYRAHLSQMPAFSEVEDVDLRHLIAMLLEKDQQKRIHSAKDAQDMVRALLAPIHLDTVTVDAPPINHSIDHTPKKLQHLHSWPLNYQPKYMTVCGHTPYIGIAHSDYINFFNAKGKSVGPIMFSHGPYIAEKNGSVVFPDTNSLIRYYPDVALRKSLTIPCKHILNAAVSHHHIALLDHHQASIYDFDGKLSANFSKQNYALEPSLCAHPEQGFLMSSGLINQELIWYAESGETLHHWHLGWPILAIVCTGNSILAACVSMDGHQLLQFWQLTTTAQREFSESVNIGDVFAANCHLIWARQHGELMVMGDDFQPYTIGELPQNSRLKAVSPSLEHVVSLSNVAQQWQCELWQLVSDGE